MMQELKAYQEFMINKMNKYGFAEQTIYLSEQRHDNDPDAQLAFLKQHGTTETYQRFLTDFENLYGVNLEEDHND